MKRFILASLLLAVAVCEPAYAGVMEVIEAIGHDGLFAGLGVVVLLYLFKIVPNDKIQAVVGKFADFLGRTATLNLAKWKWSAPFWNQYIEPFFIDLLDNTVVTFMDKFKDALRSDNANA